MTRLPVTNCKLAVLLLALLTISAANGKGKREIDPIRSMRIDIERAPRASNDDSFYRIENTRVRNSSTNAGVVCLVHSLPKAFTAIDNCPACQNAASLSTTPQSNTWRGLTPLHSTREDVEKLLGAPKDSVGKIFIYDTESEKVHVWYSEGPCKTSEIGQWNVPSGTVLQIRVYPRATTLLRDLRLDMGKYRRLLDPNIPNWAFYQNEDDGVMVQTKLENGCEQVEIITYEPTRKDIRLRCPTRE